MPSAVTKKLTPVLMVKETEPCLPMWIDLLGWTKAAEVPEGDKIGFAMLAKDGIELMYQTWASVEKDMGRPRGRPQGTSVGLFLEVSDLDDIVKRLAGI